GSRFQVRLPITIGASIMGPGGDECESPTGQCKVLVVDDNRDAAQTLAPVLELMGHLPRVVFDGLSAIDAAREFNPHIVLLDIGLPTLNGFEACQRIRVL